MNKSLAKPAEVSIMNWETKSDSAVHILMGKQNYTEMYKYMYFPTYFLVESYG